MAESTQEITETARFKAWFKGSKVVDDHGRPLRVYHGTTSEFNQFKKAPGAEGIFFTASSDIASWYTGVFSRAVERVDGKAGANVRAAYLKIKRPLTLTPAEYLCGGKQIGLVFVNTGVLKHFRFDGLHILPDPEMGHEWENDVWMVVSPSQIQNALHIGAKANTEP